MTHLGYSGSNEIQFLDIDAQVPARENAAMPLKI
jgi:hypothetical protein